MKSYEKKFENNANLEIKEEHAILFRENFLKKILFNKLQMAFLRSKVEYLYKIYF